MIDFDMDFMEALNALADEEQEDRSFRIDNDHSAEWAIRKITEYTAEANRLNAVREAMIADYRQQIDEENTRLEKRTARLRAMLMDYFETVEKRCTSTQETYRLPSGRLVRKHPKPKVERDNDTLLKWMRGNNMAAFIRSKEEPAWAELKAAGVDFDEDGNAIFSPTGEIIDGVKAVPQEAVFSVELGG